MLPFAIRTEDAIKVKEYFMDMIQNKYNALIVHLYENADALIIEDSLVILVSIHKYPTKYLPLDCNEDDFSSLEFEELTYNSINFKHNHTNFLREIERKLGIHALKEAVSYIHFNGFSRPHWNMDKKTKIEIIDENFPELKIRERYDAWQGILYNMILLKFRDCSGNIIYNSTFTTNKPHSYITSLVNGWLKHGFRYKMGNIYSQDTRLQTAFESYKNTGISRKQRIEENLSYYSFEQYFKEKNDVWKKAYEILENIDDYTNAEFTSYIKPVNQWKSEELVYKLTKKIYKNYEVIYQHQPFFLKSDKGGQMSYDVFISKLNIAIEYQGKQHFEPIDFFGGEIAFKEGKKRDELKKKISENNGIKLVYINYWEDINENIIRERVENA